jgi:hypothetical protein
LVIIRTVLLVVDQPAFRPAYGLLLFGELLMETAVTARSNWRWFPVRSKRGQRKLINDIAKITLANATVRSSVGPGDRVGFLLIAVS